MVAVTGMTAVVIVVGVVAVTGVTTVVIVVGVVAVSLVGVEVVRLVGSFVLVPAVVVAAHVFTAARVADRVRAVVGGHRGSLPGPAPSAPGDGAYALGA